MSPTGNCEYSSDRASSKATNALTRVTRKSYTSCADPRDVLISYYEFQLKRWVISTTAVWRSSFHASWNPRSSPRLAPGEIMSTVGPLRAAARETSRAPLRRHARRHPQGKYNDCLVSRIARAVTLSSADSMRKLETEQSRQWKETKNTRQDKSFVRKAASGGWRATLPERCVAQVESAWGEINALRRLRTGDNK